MEELSVFVITKNEEHCIARCLESVSWAEEIIVVDSGSTDRTQEIAESLGARFVFHEWENSNRQKQYALSLCTKAWALCLDADEAVSAELRQSIRQVLANPPPFAGYKMLRRNYYRDRPLDYGAFRPKPELRLFRRDKGEFVDRVVHDKVILDGPCGKLRGYLEHYNIEILAEWIAKNLRYAQLSAQEMHRRGKHATLASVMSPWWIFLRRYFFRKGIFHGIPGFIFSFLPAVFGFVTQFLLWEMGREEVRSQRSELRSQK